jgi:GIY-YIG catalytic domain
MPSDRDFEACVREYEAQELNRPSPKFRIGGCHIIRERWDVGGWEFTHVPGVYAFYDKDRELIYVGKADDLDRRTGSYFRRTGNERAIETRDPWGREPVFLQMVSVKCGTSVCRLKHT